MSLITSAAATPSPALTPSPTDATALRSQRERTARLVALAGTDAAQVRQRRASVDELGNWCERITRQPLDWGRRLAQRLFAAEQLAPTSSWRDDTATTTAAPLSVTPITQVEPPAPVLPPGRLPNRHGYLERGDFGLLYVVVPVSTVSELAGAARRHGLGEEDVGTIAWQDMRQSPDTDGLRPQQAFAAGRRAIDGHAIDTYLSIEAARRAAELQWGGAIGARAPMYVIEAHGLRGVSLGENRVRNPVFSRLISVSGENLVPDGPRDVAYPDSGYVAITDLMVQLRLEGDMRSRISRVE